MSELTQIMKHTEAGENFLLSGGAGSGKTYTLVEVIREIIKNHPTARIACMTYTNSAVLEIEERVDHKNLSVSTYHDFLWDSIRHFKRELKLCLIELINDENVPRISVDDNLPIPDNYFDELEDGIQYREYLRIGDGIISHDEVLVLANRIFERYPKICQILKDKYPYILIDEYQDTQTEVVEILLDHLAQSDKTSVIGFFGDSMQSIYRNGVGDLNDYLGNEPGNVFEVQKVQNRRNPKKVIDLANLLRSDGLVQEPSSDPNAPNMLDANTVKQGDIKFIYSTSDDLDPIRAYLGWDFENSRDTKELNLTHNLIASKGGFTNLMQIYDKDRIVEHKNKIKRYIRQHNIVLNGEELTFGDIMDHPEIQVNITGTIQNFFDSNPDLLHHAREQDWDKFSSMYVDKDQLVDDKKQHAEQDSKKGSKRDNLIKHLFRIQHSIHFYLNRDYNEFLRRTEFKVHSIEDKVYLKKTIEEFENIGEKSIGEVIELADVRGVCKIDDRLEEYRQKNEYIYRRVAQVPYSEFQSLYNYLEGHTPFSTQHKTKGNEFDNVLVVLDNGGWNDYNFGYLFRRNGTPSVLERTDKIFYMCCTRAKENLAVFFHNPDVQVIARAVEWFGADNVINFDELN